MSDFIDELEAITASLTGGPEFAHESVQMANIVADRWTGAVVFAPLLGTGSLIVGGAGITPTQKISVEFLKQTQFENDAADNQAIIDDMTDLAIEFTQRLRKSTVIKLVMNDNEISEFPTDFVYEQFDANFAGIMVTYDVKLRKPKSPCTPTLSP